jgi:phosphoenolpyruvate carboxykinase (ATP)
VKEPQATFSTCFGAPFMVHHPMVYAHLLGEKIQKYQAQCWMVNTGWTGGSYGVGQRMKIAYTRAIIDALLRGVLDDVVFDADPIFGVLVPQTCPGVPMEVLKSRNTWADPLAYDEQARKLAGMFTNNFEQFADAVPPEVLKAGPGI